MSYASVTFLLLFCALLLFYFLLPRKAQWVVLLIFSLTLYFLFSTRLPVYLCVTALITFAASSVMDLISKKTENRLESSDNLSREEKKAVRGAGKKKEKALLITAVVLNLSLLAVFKYTPDVGSVLARTGVIADTGRFNLLLPLGISFYTFQSLGYLIDLYRRKTSYEKNFFRLLLFLCYFPQLIEGPINRHAELAPQLSAYHNFSFERFKKGSFLTLWGFFKKMVIADNLAMIINLTRNNVDSYDGFQLFFAMLLFGIQLYADFSGYMDIVTGLSDILGIGIAENFKRPYFSRSVTDFWRKWHMSLCTWFRDYVFYPVYMSKGSMNLGKKLRSNGHRTAAKNVPTFLATILVWFLTGLWHAMSGPEIAWGVCNGLIMISALQFRPQYLKINGILHIKTESAIWKLFQMVRTYVIMTFLNYMSEFSSLTEIFHYTGKIASSLLPHYFRPAYLFPGLADRGILVMVAVLIAPVLLLLYSVYEEKGKSVIARITSSHWLIQTGVGIFLIIYIISFGSLNNSAGAFMYAQY